jgi:hypothetical protein
MVSPKAFVTATVSIVLLLLTAVMTLPYWLSYALNVTSIGSSIQLGSADWEESTQLHVDQLIYYQDGLKIQVDGIRFNWVELMDFSLSALAIDIERLTVVYQKTISEVPRGEEEALQLPEQLPALTINRVEVVYDEVKVPIQATLMHRNDNPYPISIVAEYLNEALGTLDFRWDNEKLYGSLILNGPTLTKFIQDPAVVERQKLELEKMLLSGDLKSDFNVDIVNKNLKARVVMPRGSVEHKQLDIAWTTPLNIDLNASSTQWQAKVTEPFHGSVSEFSDIYKHIEWPALIQSEQLPLAFNFVLNKGSQFDNEQYFSGGIEIKTENTILTLEQLQVSERQQQGIWRFKSNTPPWLDLDADVEITGGGDFLYTDDWIVNITPKISVSALQYAGLGCQSIIVDTNEAIQLTLKEDEITELNGELRAAINQCKHGDLNIDEWLTQLHIVNPEQAKLVFEWPGNLNGEADLNRLGTMLMVRLDAQTNDTNALIQHLSSSMAAYGATKLEGQASIDLKQLDDANGHWKASFLGNGQYDDIKANGIDLMLHGALNKSVIEVVSTSYIKVNTLDSGVPISNLKAAVSGQVSMENVDLQVTDMKGELLDGSLSIDRIALKPEATGTSLLKLDNITLNAVAQLQSQEGIALHGEISGRFPVEFDSSGVHIKEGKFYNITPGFIRVKDNPGVQNLKQSSEQAAQALNLLENLDFEILNSTVNFTPTGDLTLAVSIEGRNPDIDQAINFNYTHEENLYQLLQSLRLGDKLTEKVQQQYQERTQ